jgi:CheY-like chemotaxis protein
MEKILPCGVKRDTHTFGLVSHWGEVYKRKYDSPGRRRAQKPMRGCQNPPAPRYEVAEAAGRNEALALLNKSHFDLIITDLKMPDQSGLVLLAHIRAKWPQVLLIMMSGYLSEAAGKIVSDRFSEFLRKPIDPPTLIATVRRLLT